jgi:2-methylcitrate dehydratase
MQKIEVRDTEELTALWPDAYPFRLTVTTRSGKKHFREIYYAKGHPKNPMSDEEIETKFRKLSQSVLGEAGVDNALRVLWRMDSMKTVSEIFEPFVLKR